MRRELEAFGANPDHFGWASVQLDGGIESVLEKVERWFSERIADSQGVECEEVSLDALRVGVLSTDVVSEVAARSLGALTRTLVGEGATVVIPETGGLMTNPRFVEDTFLSSQTAPSLTYGQPVGDPGFYTMESPTEQWVENLTGVAATGVEVLLGYTAGHPMQGHPMIPMILISDDGDMNSVYGDDSDLFLAEDALQNVDRMLGLIIEVASRRYTPKTGLRGNTDIQFTRGLLGVSM